MIRQQDIIGLIKFGLENLDILDVGNKKVRVKDVFVINEDTLCCDFYSYFPNSIDIKMEIGLIMGFFNGFFRKDQFDGISFSYYAVKAYNSNDEELIYAISSKATAELIGTGNSIDWLKSTLFQENTDDYRLAQSKRIISEIENCLRELVKTRLSEQFGDDWWDKSLDTKLGKDVKQTYFNQFGTESNEGDILIAYTYTLQLKKIISTHFKLFKPYFDSLVDFGRQMDKLNRIRREEAHNRSIADNDLSELKNLHERLISRALVELTSFQSGYLIENWRLKIKKIMVERLYKPIHDSQEVLDERDPFTKLQRKKENIEHLISYLNETIMKLKSITTPVQKKETQRELVSVLEKFKDLQVKMRESYDMFDENEIRTTSAEIDLHIEEMDRFIEKFLLAES